MYSGLILFLLGLVFGSFVSAVTYRVPLGISFVRGRSICPRCKKSISWYDNIPLFSFLLLGGRCRNCRGKISLRYPAIELATGIGFFIIGLNVYYLFVFLVLLSIFVIDMEHQIIPDSLVFLLLTVVFIYSLLSSSPSLFPDLFAGFFTASFLLAIHLATRGRGMGLGDVKFAVVAGLLVSLRLSFVWLLVAFLTGGLVAFILILGKGAKLKDKIAFGPFLIFSIPVTLLYGEKILFWLHLG